MLAIGSIIIADWALHAEPTGEKGAHGCLAPAAKTAQLLQLTLMAFESEYELLHELHL